MCDWTGFWAMKIVYAAKHVKLARENDSGTAPIRNLKMEENFAQVQKRKLRIAIRNPAWSLSVSKSRHSKWSNCNSEFCLSATIEWALTQPHRAKLLNYRPLLWFFLPTFYELSFIKSKSQKERGILKYHCNNSQHF